MRIMGTIRGSRLAAIGVALALVSGSALASQATGDDWTLYTDPDSGITISYPHSLFPETEKTDEGLRFIGGDAEIEISARDDIGVSSTDELRNLMLNAEGYASLTYSPAGRNWMVASGYRNGDVYYEKFFVRGGKLRAFSIRYPKEARATYDPVVERLEDEFKPW
jgi:hypothetical protein